MLAKLVVHPDENHHLSKTSEKKCDQKILVHLGTRATQSKNINRAKNRQVVKSRYF